MEKIKTLETKELINILETRIGTLSKTQITFVSEHLHPENDNEEKNLPIINNEEFETFMNTPYEIVVFDDFVIKGTYVAFCPELDGCISFGKTIGGVLYNLNQAKKRWFINNY